MILQVVDPTSLLEIAKGCGVVTYILMATNILFVGTLVYIYREWRSESRKKDEEIAALNKAGLLNLEVFQKLTEALDRILVDDRENAEAIKHLIAEIRTEIKSSKEIIIMKMEHVGNMVMKDGKKE